MKRGKRFLSMLLVIVMIIAMAGCAGSSGESESDDGNGDKIKITFMSRDSGDTPIAKVYEDQIAEFMEENPDIEVQNDSIYEEGCI